MHRSESEITNDSINFLFIFFVTKDSMKVLSYDLRYSLLEDQYICFFFIQRKHFGKTTLSSYNTQRKYITNQTADITNQSFIQVLKRPNNEIN